MTPTPEQLAQWRALADSEIERSDEYAVVCISATAVLELLAEVERLTAELDEAKYQAWQEAMGEDL